MKKVIPISEVCKAQRLAYAQKITISTGETLVAKTGDWLVESSAGDFFLVPHHLFCRTYHFLPDDVRECTCTPDVSCHSDRNHRLPRPAAWEEPETSS